MISELIILADKLDKHGEKHVANLIDKLIKYAIDDWDDEPTIVDPVARGLKPLPPLSELLRPRKKEQIEQSIQKPNATALPTKPIDANKPDVKSFSKQMVQELLMRIKNSISNWSGLANEANDKLTAQLAAERVKVYVQVENWILEMIKESK